MNNLAVRWLLYLCALGALGVVTGCSSSAKPYTLVAQLPPLSQTHMVAATIDVEGSRCGVRVMTLDSSNPWTPACAVISDQSGFKDFTIDGKEVKFGAVDNGFKVLSTNPPTLPPPASTAPAATTVKAAAIAKSPAPAASTAVTTATAVTGESFPDQWVQAPYPGHVKLQGQNLGFLVQTATLTISGSAGMLDVVFKGSYSPLHLKCSVIADQRGDYTLLFNPAEASKATGGGNYSILLSSEGQSISGNIWDSHGFDSWTPSLPPQWAAVAYTAD